METVPVSPPAAAEPLDPVAPSAELVPATENAPATAKVVSAAPGPASFAGDAYGLAFQSSPEFAELIGALTKAQIEFFEAERNKTANVESKRTGARYSYRYADLAEIIDATQEALNKHGLAITQFPFMQQQGAGCITFLAHTSGQWFRNVLKLPLEDFNAQGAGKVITYARRYAWQSICGIAPTESDDDAAPSIQNESRRSGVQMPQRASASNGNPPPAGYDPLTFKPVAPAPVAKAELTVVKTTGRQTSGRKHYLAVELSDGRNVVTFDPSLIESFKKLETSKRALKEVVTHTDANKWVHVDEVIL